MTRQKLQHEAKGGSEDSPLNLEFGFTRPVVRLIENEPSSFEGQPHRPAISSEYARLG